MVDTKAHSNTLCQLQGSEAMRWNLRREKTKQSSQSDLCMVTDLTWTTPNDHKIKRNTIKSRMSRSLELQVEEIECVLREASHVYCSLLSRSETLMHIILQKNEYSPNHEFMSQAIVYCKQEWLWPWNYSVPMQKLHMDFHPQGYCLWPWCAQVEDQWAQHSNPTSFRNK